MRWWLIFALTLSGLAQAPQIPLTGNIGPGGNFPFRNSITIGMADADHTLVYPETSAGLIKLSGTLTTQRNLIALTGDYAFCVKNGTNQPVQVIGASGSGVVIPSAGYQCVQGDGTNYQTAATNPLSLQTFNSCSVGGGKNCSVTTYGGAGGTPGTYNWIRNNLSNLTYFGPASFGGAEGTYPNSNSTTVADSTDGGLQVNSLFVDKMGLGDFYPNFTYWSCESGWAYGLGSDTGCGMAWEEGGEGRQMQATVATYSAPTLTLAGFSCPGGNVSQQCRPSDGNWLIDTTQTPIGVGHFTGPSVAFSGSSAPWLHQIPSTATLPVTSVWGYANGLTITGYTTPNAPIAQTIALQGGAGTFAANDLVCIAGYGSGLMEQSKITSVSGSSPTQTLNLPLARPWGTVTIAKGGCGIIGFDANLALNGQITAYPYWGSLDGSTVVYMTEGEQGPGAFQIPQAGNEPEVVSPAFQTTHTYTAGDYIWDGTNVQQVTVGGVSAGSTPTWNASLGGATTIGPTVSGITPTSVNVGLRSNFHIYHAGRITSNSWVPSGNNYAYQSSTLEPNSMTLAPGDAVVNPNLDAQNIQGHQAGIRCQTANSANGVCVGLITSIDGMGAGPNSTAHVLGNTNPLSMYFNTTTGLSTGVGLPSALASYYGGTGTGAFGTFWNAPYAPNCLFCMAAPLPGQIGTYLAFNNTYYPNIFLNWNTHVVEIQGGLTVRDGCTNCETVYNASGTLQANAHTVRGSVTVAAASTAVTFTGAAVFSSASTYSCVASAETVTAGSMNVPITYSSGSSFTIVGDFGGTFNGTARYICTGN